jgi:hypothetical protein
LERASAAEPYHPSPSQTVVEIGSSSSW